MVVLEKMNISDTDGQTHEIFHINSYKKGEYKEQIAPFAPYVHKYFLAI